MRSRQDREIRPDTIDLLKNRFMLLSDKFLERLRSIIETVIDKMKASPVLYGRGTVRQLNNISHLEHSRHQLRLPPFAKQVRRTQTSLVNFGVK